MRLSISQIIFGAMCMVGWLSYFSVKAVGDGYSVISTLLIIITEMPWALISLLFAPEMKVGSASFFFTAFASQAFNLYLLKPKKRAENSGSSPP